MVATVEERVSFIEGRLDQFATKADVADLKTEMAEIESRIIKWMVAMQLLAVGAIAAIMAAIVQVLR